MQREVYVVDIVDSKINVNAFVSAGLEAADVSSQMINGLQELRLVILLQVWTQKEKLGIFLVALAL